MKRTANRTRPKVMNAGMVVLARALETKIPGTRILGTGIIDPGCSGIMRVPGPLFKRSNLPFHALLRFDGCDRLHVQNPARGHRWGEDVRRARRADQDWSDGN